MNLKKKNKLRKRLAKGLFDQPRPRQVRMVVTVDFCKGLLTMVDSLRSQYWPEAVMNCALHLVDWDGQKQFRNKTNDSLQQRAESLAETYNAGGLGTIEDIRWILKEVPRIG